MRALRGGWRQTLHPSLGVKNPISPFWAVFLRAKQWGMLYAQFLSGVNGLAGVTSGTDYVVFPVLLVSVRGSRQSAC
jgi:hypothetical protein